MYIYIHVCIYMYIYVRVCVCVPSGEVHHFTTGAVVFVAQYSLHLPQVLRLTTTTVRLV